ncbi:hypothetical protein GP486_005741 [Trichoglossum hirsutum]|uniref:Uncharacterized protein n=1 Tax=Trichoglossum hirsutum TaxID=265104 RepID=A0A9P8L8L6_9PEZI|nr:hypothetical protein GP486_005741 [Trichoglossum hirsutum]
MVTSNLTATENNGSSLISAYVGGGYDSGSWGTSASWICDAYGKWRAWARWCSLDWASTFADHWLQPGLTENDPKVLVDHCLVGDQGNNNERCGIHYSSYILVIVCVCTISEAMVVFLIWRNQRKIATVDKQTKMRQTTMVTIGDAIANFLQEPDSGAGSISDKSFKASARPCGIKTTVKAWPSDCHSFWFAAVRVQVWVVSLALFAIGLIIPSVLLGVSVQTQKSQRIPLDIWGQGFKVQDSTIMGGVFGYEGHGTFGIIPSVLFANSWQLMVSFLYIFYNNVLTRQLVADEWMRFIETNAGRRDRDQAKHKKPLRVSSPIGLQRSSYTLSLPLTYSIPLISLFILLHWLVSQSIFVVQTIVFGPGANAYRIPAYDASRIGYSVLGIIFSISVGVSLVLALLINSFTRKYVNAPCEFPSMAINSAAISAVCQRPEDDEDAHLFPVSLGVITDSNTEAMKVDGRLTFSTFIDIQPPQSGGQYLQPVIVHQDSATKRSFSRTRKTVGYARLT